MKTNYCPAMTNRELQQTIDNEKKFIKDCLKSLYKKDKQISKKPSADVKEKLMNQCAALCAKIELTQAKINRLHMMKH